MCDIEVADDQLTCTRQMIPLTWRKAIDALLAGTKSFLSFAEATAIIQSCDIPTCDVEALLTHLHDTGYVMWHNEPVLKEVVITDPIEYFINAVATLICKHAPSVDVDGDATRHFNEVHREAMKSHRNDWNILMEKGLVSTPLLCRLLQSCNDQIDIVIKLMEKLAMLTPVVRIDDNWGFLLDVGDDNAVASPWPPPSQSPPWAMRY